MVSVKSSCIVLGVLCFLVEYGLSYDANFRLSNNHIPRSYDLEMVVNPATSDYNGTVKIYFSTKTRTNVIRLHACPSFLTLKNITVNDKNVCNVSHPATELENRTEIVTLTCKDNIEAANKNNITITYTGIYRPHMRYHPFNDKGLKLARYKIAEKSQPFVASQFEPMFARRAFPCFDEPQFKAEFNVTIIHPERYRAIFNTQVYSEKVARRTMTSKFEKTPVMSPHLLSLVVSQVKTAKTNISTPERANETDNIYILTDQLEHIGILQTYGKVLLAALDSWIGISYEVLGIKKMDFIVLPFQYIGAEGSWGLISFHEFDVLDDGNITSPEKKQFIITNIAYELALQWFDDYVTPDWWSNVWIKEAFAGYLQYLIPDQVQNLQLDQQRQFVIDYVQPALYTDSPYPYGDPLSSKDEDVYWQEHIASKIWNINFQKGACILRMIEGILGKDNFKKGVQHYLTKNKYKNTNPSILLNNLEKYTSNSAYSLSTIMHEWIYKPGYPLVTVNLREDGKYFEIEQDEYSNNGKNKTTWHIPLTYTTGKEKQFEVKVKNYLYNKPLVLEMKQKTWIIVNLQQSGFYRVNYDNELWKRIIDVLKSKDMKEIHVSNRAQLIDDAFTLSKKGIISYNISLELLEYIRHETEYEPWFTAEIWIKETIYKLVTLKDKTYLQKFKATVLSWIKEAFPEDIDAKTHLQKLTKNVISELKNILEATYPLGESKYTFEEYVSEQSQNQKAGMKTIVCRGLEINRNSASSYEILMAHFRKSKSALERKQILDALECVDEPNDLEMFLLETISEESQFSGKDVRRIFTSVYKNANLGVEVYLKFLKMHLSNVLNRYKFLSPCELLLKAAERIINENQLSELKEVVEKYQVLDNIRVIGESLIEETERQLVFQAEQVDNIVSYLKLQ